MSDRKVGAAVIDPEPSARGHHRARHPRRSSNQDLDTETVADHLHVSSCSPARMVARAGGVRQGDCRRLPALDRRRSSDIVGVLSMRDIVRCGPRGRDDTCGWRAGRGVAPTLALRGGAGRPGESGSPAGASRRVQVVRLGTGETGVLARDTGAIQVVGRAACDRAGARRRRGGRRGPEQQRSQGTDEAGDVKMSVVARPIERHRQPNALISGMRLGPGRWSSSPAGAPGRVQPLSVTRCRGRPPGMSSRR